MLVYGCEAWELDDSLIKSLKGWCSRCVCSITGNDYRMECVNPSYPLIGKIKQRRLKWLGKVLIRS